VYRCGPPCTAFALYEQKSVVQTAHHKDENAKTVHRSMHLSCRTGFSVTQKNEIKQIVYFVTDPFRNLAGLELDKGDIINFTDTGDCIALKDVKLTAPPGRVKKDWSSVPCVEGGSTQTKSIDRRLELLEVDLDDERMLPEEVKLFKTFVLNEENERGLEPLQLYGICDG
jgi:hypothetical protein